MRFQYFSFPNLKASCLVAGLSVTSVGAFSAPAVDSVSLAGVGQEDRAKLVATVFGAGFGEKEQAAPVLFDLVETAYENGTLNDHQSSFSDGQRILPHVSDKKAIWVKATTRDWQKMSLTKSRPGRVPESESHYYFTGPSTFLGWPAAYGGVKTPVGNSQLYVSWWYKPKYNPQYYWKFSSVDQHGRFLEGERLEIGGKVKGIFIGVDYDGLLNAELHDSEGIKGATIKGLKSGATAKFPSEFRAGSGVGYETPGSQKFIRIWEEGTGKNGIRFSWTQMHQTGFGKPNWEAAPVVGGEWNLFEVEMDTDHGRVDLRVNGEIFTTYRFDSGDFLDGPGSPTIALLGLDGKTGPFQEGELDDIYMDKTLQRVVVGNAPSFQDVSHYEIQRPTVWESSKLQFEVRLGALERASEAYVYVFDKNGNVNAKGHPLCEACNPPAPIVLEVN